MANFRPCTVSSHDAHANLHTVPHRRVAERSSGLYAERSPSFRVQSPPVAIPSPAVAKSNTGTVRDVFVVISVVPSVPASRASRRPVFGKAVPSPFSFVVVLVRVDSQRFFRASNEGSETRDVFRLLRQLVRQVFGLVPRAVHPSTHGIVPGLIPGMEPRDGAARPGRPERPRGFLRPRPGGRFLSEASGVRVVHAAEPVVIRHLVIVRQTRSTMLVAMSRAVFLAMVVVVIDGRPRAFATRASRLRAVRARA